MNFDELAAMWVDIALYVIAPFVRFARILMISGLAAMLATLIGLALCRR